MTRAELMELVYEDFGRTIDRRRIREAVYAVFDTITASLERGERVEFRGFGSFSTTKHDARTGRDPRTGEPVDVPEKHHPQFRSSKLIIHRINGWDTPPD